MSHPLEEAVYVYSTDGCQGGWLQDAAHSSPLHPHDQDGGAEVPKATVTRQKRWNEWPGPSFHKLPLRHRSVRATRCSTRYSAGTETATPLRNMYDNS